MNIVEKLANLKARTKSMEEIVAQLNRGMIDLGLRHRIIPSKPDIRKAFRLNPRLIVRA